MLGKCESVVRYNFLMILEGLFVCVVNVVVLLLGVVSFCFIEVLFRRKRFCVRFVDCICLYL